MALALRPNCECCDRDLPPASSHARICSYECTFCADCVDTVLKNVCPNCGGNLRKLFNAVGVVFKGSGFYRTDSRSGSSSSVTPSARAAKLSAMRWRSTDGARASTSSGEGA